MTSVVIFDHVGKRYRLGRERMNIRMAIPGRWGAQPVGVTHAALDDVSFTLTERRSLGIVGPNGAGKSTLLKLVAKVIEPTTGTVTVNGRTAALIELGAGFHPDMTGRENVRFSAAVLGMDRRSVGLLLDEIVDFADIGDYLDTPVKRYSSGMLARLGFAVASHLDAEVLVIDEVLSVGDAAFQRRCHERIVALRDEGRSILYVTHNLWTVPHVCDHALLLDRGRLVMSGEPTAVLDAYHHLGTATSTIGSTSGTARIARLSVSNHEIDRGEPLVLELDLHLEEPLADGHIAVNITGPDGVGVLAGTSSWPDGPRLDKPGNYCFTLKIREVPLHAGAYTVFVSVLPDRRFPVVESQARAAFDLAGIERDQPTYGAAALDIAWTERRPSRNGQV